MLNHVYTYLYINCLYISLIYQFRHLIYKQRSLYINLYIKKQHIFL